MHMGGWFFCRDREAEVHLASPTPAGALSVALAGANLIFSPGDPLFVAESDGTAAEFLGAAGTVSSESVHFTLPVRSAKSTGAVLWRAGAVLHLAAGAARPLVRRLATGVALERALDGTHFAVRTSAPRETLDLKLEGMTPARERALRDWLASQTLDGLRPFSLVAPDRRVFAVRLDAAAFERAERDATRASVRLPLVVLAEGVCP